MRLIDADAFREKMYHEVFEKDSDMQKWDSGCWIRYKLFENQIDKAPTIEERKTGRWIYGEKDCQDGWYCSECKFFIPWDYDYYGLNNIDFIRDYHTCPHCDAKMLTYTGGEDGGGA